jgi:N-acetylneuraminic acid mutarotase
MMYNEGGNMNHKFLVCLVLFLSLGFAQKKVVKKSDVIRLSPRLLNYQGYLTDTLGNPITNPFLSLSFAIFDAVSGGNQKWTETQSSVSVNKGIFNVLLGSVTPIPDSVFTASTSRYLQLTVAGQVVSPRTPIVSTGYAVASTYADTALYAKSAAPTGGVPSGYSILGTTTTPPVGYTYTGWYLSVAATEMWFTKANMPTARYGLAAVEVNGKIYAIGGYNGGVLQTNEEYDPVTNTWQIRTGMPTGRIWFAAATVNGKIYALGGGDPGWVQTNEEYDPVANTWQTKADMPTGRYYLAGAAVNGKIYALGGGDPAWLRTNEEYDPVADTWQTRADMPEAKGCFAAAAINGKIYTMGGASGSSNANREYDPVANTWQGRANMPTGRIYLAAAVANGKIYAIGGTYSAAFQTNEEYDPVANTWQTRANMPTARYGLGAAAVNGKVYAIGGYNTDNLGINEAYQSSSILHYIHMKN